MKSWGKSEKKSENRTLGAGCGPGEGKAKGKIGGGREITSFYSHRKNRQHKGEENVQMENDLNSKRKRCLKGMQR